MALGAARMGSAAGLSALRAGTGMGTATAGAVGMGPVPGMAASSSAGMSSSMAAGTPDWARRLRAEQRRRTHTQTAMQAIREGDRPGAGANPSFDDGRS
jgi:type IV secretion system protein TrbL